MIPIVRHPVYFLLLMILPGLVYAEPNPEQMLNNARQALANGRYRQCWKWLDRASCNHPRIRHLAEAIRADLHEKGADPVGRVSLSTWKNGKKGAVTITFDDSHGAQAAGEMWLHEWEGTFYLTNRGDRLLKPGAHAEWSKVAALGHELGNHTSTHPGNLPGLPPSEIRRELEDCTEILQTFTTESIRTFAFPSHNLGTFDGPLRVKVRELFVAARGGLHASPIVEFPATPNQMDSVASIALRQNTEPPYVVKRIDQFLDESAWLILLLHGIQGVDVAYQPAKPETWNATVKHLQANEDDLWIASFADIAEYVIARRTADIQSFISSHQIRVSIGCSIDPAEVRIPLTIRVRVPDPWTVVEIAGDEQNVDAHHVRLNLFPNASPVTIRRIEGLSARSSARQNALGEEARRPAVSRTSSDISYQSRIGAR